MSTAKQIKNFISLNKRLDFSLAEQQNLHCISYPSDIDPLCNDALFLPEIEKMGATLLDWLVLLCFGYPISELGEGDARVVFSHPTSLWLRWRLLLSLLESPKRPMLTGWNALSAKVLLFDEMVSLWRLVFCLWLVSLIFGLGLLLLFVSRFELVLGVAEPRFEFDERDFEELFLLTFTEESLLLTAT